MKGAWRGDTRISGNPDNMLRTFKLKKTTLVDLSRFLEVYPEVGSLNHLVEVALSEFVELH